MDVADRGKGEADGDAGGSYRGLLIDGDGQGVSPLLCQVKTEPRRV